MLQSAKTQLPLSDVSGQMHSPLTMQEWLAVGPKFNYTLEVVPGQQRRRQRPHQG